MRTFERACADAERAGSAAVKAAGLLMTSARQLVKSAQEGDASKIRKATERLAAAGEAARQEVANANSVWPFTQEEEEAYFRADYEAELISQAKEDGLEIHRNEERLIAFPSLIRILPGESAVQVNRKKVSAVRPSRLVAMLKANQSQKPRFPVERFVEALFAAYKLVVGREGLGSTVSLARIYEAFTLLPGTNRDYDTSDFGRDLFFLDRSGIDRTRSGIRLSLPAATGTKGGKAFRFVSPDGQVVTYYGITFAEAPR